MSSGDKQTLSISLPAKMINWLDSSAKKHSLSSQSKAVRCCVNCVAIGDVEMVSEADDADRTLETSSDIEIELASQQLQWIYSICDKSDGPSSQSEVVRSVINACMSPEVEDTVFGVVRCKKKVSECGGAQKSIELLSKKFGEDGVVVKEDIKLL